MKRYAISCRRGNAVPTFPPGPDQKTYAKTYCQWDDYECAGGETRTSAEEAARGHTMLSRLEGLVCSVHTKCWPEFIFISMESKRDDFDIPPMTSEY
jgi:hypothetical protein